MNATAALDSISIRLAGVALDYAANRLGAKDTPAMADIRTEVVRCVEIAEVEAAAGKVESALIAVQHALVLAGRRLEAHPELWAVQGELEILTEDNRPTKRMRADAVRAGVDSALESIDSLGGKQ